MDKKGITISGGYDSGCLPFLVGANKVSEYDFVFFEYQQTYMRQEKQRAENLASYFNMALKIVRLPECRHDQERRNFIFISELKKLGYSEILMGNRGILPFFDAYRDSNFIYLKIVARLFNIKVQLPIVGWSKLRVLRFLSQNQYLDFYNCYAAKEDWLNCDCPNCTELRKVKNKI